MVSDMNEAAKAKLIEQLNRAGYCAEDDEYFFVEELDDRFVFVCEEGGVVGYLVGVVYAEKPWQCADYACGPLKGEIESLDVAIAWAEGFVAGARNKG